MTADPPDVKTLFGKALEIESPAEREAFLDRACGENASLRADLAGLLAAAASAGSFLNRPAVQIAGDPSAATPTVIGASLVEQPGAVIGPYKLLQQVGEGGFGVVYLAEQERPVRRMVALKIIKAGMDTREVIARFEAERQALAMMDHQNIARVLDAGATDSGRPYFVMELVKGIPITEYCNNHTLTPRERLELFVPVCQAIQHAHQKGIIHRDIKPSNVLVCLYDGKPVPKVIDFGVAKAIETRLTEKTMFTRHGQVLGTLEYMSPEQAELSQLDIDTRSDIYSLGVLLYELLTGSTPITKEQFRQAGFSEMLRMIRETEPDKPSTRLSRSHATLASLSAQRRTEPAKLGAVLRGELDWLVMKSLEKDRTRRYETAIGLARDIERYLRDEPVEACPPSLVYRVQKFVRRHRGSVAVGGLVALLVIALLGNFVIGYYRLKAAQDLAAAEAERARRAEAAAIRNLEDSQASRKQAQNERDRAVAAEKVAVRQREREAQAGEELLDALGASLFQQARAVRMSGQAGRRWESLGLLKRAEILRARQKSKATPAVASHELSLPERPELRTEAVAALLLDDGRVAREWPGAMHAVSPDGRFAISAMIDLSGRNIALNLIDLKTGETVREWRGRDAQAMMGTQLALGPGAEKLAIVSLDRREAALWDLRSTRLIRRLSMPGPAADAAKLDTEGAKPMLRRGTIRQLAFSPDGRCVVVSNANDQRESSIVLWTLDDPGEGQVLGSGREVPFRIGAFSPDSRRVAFAESVTRVVLWNIPENRVESHIDVPIAINGALGFDPRGDRLAMHFIEGDDAVPLSSLLLWDLAQNRQAARFHCGSLTSLAPVSFAPDGNRVAVSGISEIILLDLRESARQEERPPLRFDHGSLTQILDWSAEGRLISGGLAGLKMWEFADEHALSSWRPESVARSARFSRLAFSPDDRTVAVEPWPGPEVLLIERATGKTLHAWRAVIEPASTVGMRFSPDGQRLVRFSDSRLRVWDVQTGQEQTGLAADAAGQSIGMRPDGSLLAAGMQGPQPRVSDAATGKVLWQPQRSVGLTAAVSPNGRFAIAHQSFAINGDPSILVWDLDKNSQRFVLAGPKLKAFQTLSEISPDGRWILSLYSGGDVAKAMPPGVRGRRAANVSSSAAVLPTPINQTFGTGMASIVGPDQEWFGEIWNAETGQRHCQIYGPSSIENFAFSSDGRYLAVGMKNGSIRVWDVNSASELFDWRRPVAAPGDAQLTPRQLAFAPEGPTLAVPDPASPILHLLDLSRVNRQLEEASLGW